MTCTWRRIGGRTIRFWKSFRAFATARGIEFSPAEFERDRSWIRDRVREELFITAFSKEESDRVAYQNEPEVVKAVESLPSSKALIEKARQIIARQPKKTARRADPLDDFFMTPDPTPAPEAGSNAGVLDVYLAAILEIADTISTISPEMGETYREQLTGLKNRLAFKADAKTLEESRNALREILTGFSERARGYSQALREELNQTLAMVARNEDTRSLRSVRYVGHLIDFVDQMEESVRAVNLARLAQQAVDLRQFAESIELDSRDHYEQLREKLDQFQHRLHEAELLASRDPLTGVANRRELDRQLDPASRPSANSASCYSI